MQSKVAYNKPFPGTCIGGSFIYWTAFFYARTKLCFLDFKSANPAFYFYKHKTLVSIEMFNYLYRYQNSRYVSF